MSWRQEVEVGDGLEQVVERVHPVTVDGILVEGSSEDNARAGIHHLCKFQTVQFRHLNVKKEYS